MARTPSKPKPHIPYRGDDPSVGKKTGIKVARVERTSDGYERFNDLLSQANSRTPPRRKKKSIPRDDEEDDDENDEDEDEDEDEVSMDSLVQYSTTPRATTSGRPILRGASVDFDAVPTPRARKSVGHAGPSRLRTLTARELLEQDEDEDDGPMADHYADDFGHEEDEPVRSPTRDKGKGKAVETPSPRKGKRMLPPVEEEDEEELEDSIVQGMVDVEQDASDEEEEVAPPKKKAKSTRAPPARQDKPKPTNSRKHKENRDHSEGARRSKRVAYPPLEFWRGEKVVFAPREEGHPRQVPYIKEIVRIPKDDAPPRAAPKRKRSQTRATPQILEREVIVEVPVDVGNPEAGWDDETDPQAVVADYRSGASVTRRVAFTAKMFKPTPAAGNSWFFEKTFSDGDFVAAGQIKIPAKGRKPSKGTKDNTYIFFVVEGAVNVVVNETSVVLASGGMFMVPRGNSYFIENIADRDAKIFFTQARKMRDDEEHTPPTTPRAVSVAMGVARAGSSAGGRSASTTSGR
ncbi:Mif2/CENP-C like-domain-containing protein [Mycena vulgaris]|nr:Mif2/CENP-C like-domain-containing protein [Mycena vulgaris]